MTRHPWLFPIALGLFVAAGAVLLPHIRDPTGAYLAGYTVAMVAVFISYELLGEGPA